MLGNIYLSDTCVIVDLLAIPNAFYTQELDHLRAFRLTCFCLDCVCMSHCYLFDVCKLEIFSVCLFRIYHRHTPYILHMFVKMYHEIVSTPALESYAWVKIPALPFTRGMTLGKVHLLSVKWEYYYCLPQSSVVKMK